ncbi:MAG: transposase [Verrucomicrobiales bacterium]
MNHNTPFWIRESEETFFITVCCQDRGGDPLTRRTVAEGLLESVRHRNDNAVWWCSAFVVMPDHVHGLIRFSPCIPMKMAMKRWKSWTAKAHGIRWQSQWFDHRLRGDEEWRRKADYLLNNPVRADLVQQAEEWPWRLFAGR